MAVHLGRGGALVTRPHRRVRGAHACAQAPRSAQADCSEPLMGSYSEFPTPRVATFLDLVRSPYPLEPLCGPISQSWGHV